MMIPASQTEPFILLWSVPQNVEKLVSLKANKTTTDISSFTQEMVSVANFFFPSHCHAYQSAG